MKYIIYLRVSTEQQVKSGLGLEAQRQICLKYIPPNSEVLEYSDEGYSGCLEIEKRPALLSAINCLSKDDIMLVATRDRIGRDPIVNAMIERAVERKKAKLISASGDVSEENDPSSILMRRMVDAFSEYERLTIGSRIKVALAIKKTRNERVGYIPYGYRLHENGVHILVDEHEQNVLEFMKKKRFEGASLRGIAKALNTNDIQNRQGNHWNHISVRRVMK